MPVTVIRWPAQEMTPRFVVVWPAPAAVVGGVHPAGTSICSVPFEVPPAGALQRIVCDSPDCEADAFVNPRRMAAPLPPSTPYTVIVGEAPRFVSVPRLDERSCVVQTTAPVVDGRGRTRSAAGRVAVLQHQRLRRSLVERHAGDGDRPRAGARDRDRVRTAAAGRRDIAGRGRRRRLRRGPAGGDYERDGAVGHAPHGRRVRQRLRQPRLRRRRSGERCCDDPRAVARLVLQREQVRGPERARHPGRRLVPGCAGGRLHAVGEAGGHVRTAGGGRRPLADEALTAALRDRDAVGDGVRVLQHLACRRRRDGETGRVPGCGGAAAVHGRDGARALVEADERVDALVRDEPAGGVGVARPGERDRSRLRAVDQMPVDRLLDRPCGVLRGGADLIPPRRRRDRTGRADGHLCDHHVAVDRRRGLRDAEARRTGRRGGGAGRRAARSGGKRARGDERDRVDQVRNRKLRIVEPQAEDPARPLPVERPVQAGGRDVAAAAVEDRDRQDVEADGLPGARERDAAVCAEVRNAVRRIEPPVPRACSLTPVDREELLGAVDPEEDRLAAEARGAFGAVSVALPRAGTRVARGERERRGADAASRPRRSIESVAPVANRRASDASGLDAPSARSTNVDGVVAGRNGSMTAAPPATATLRTRADTRRADTPRERRRDPAGNLRCFKGAAPLSSHAQPPEVASRVGLLRVRHLSAKTGAFLPQKGGACRPSGGGGTAQSRQPSSPSRATTAARSASSGIAPVASRQAATAASAASFGPAALRSGSRSGVPGRRGQLDPVVHDDERLRARHGRGHRSPRAPAPRPGRPRAPRRVARSRCRGSAPGRG